MISNLEARVYRLEELVSTLSAWLVSAQTGFGKQDYEAIDRLINESRDKYDNDRLMALQDEED